MMIVQQGGRGMGKTAAMKEWLKHHSRKPFWLSVKPAKDCLFSRRNGYRGRIIAGYSICLRLFNKDII